MVSNSSSNSPLDNLGAEVSPVGLCLNIEVPLFNGASFINITASS
jgi:hypothetical protein